MNHANLLLCGVELGGTKCVCLVGTGPDDVRERLTLRTEIDAAETLRRIVGVGLVSAGRPLCGWHHPELGHIRVARAPGDDWPGNCRFHGACVEGLASGPAIEARTGTPPASLPVDSPVWDTVAYALAQLAHNLVLTLAPQRILIGGGVAREQTHLFPRIRQYLRRSINNYIDIEHAGGRLEEYIVAPGLGELAGPLGALAVAATAGSSGS